MPIPNTVGPRIAISRMLNRPPRVTLPPMGAGLAAPHIPAAHFPHPHIGRAGGGIVDSPAAPFTGPIRGASPGRADAVPMHVPNNSYVLPAWFVSHIGEGNSENGHLLLTKMFGQPWGAQGGPWGAQTPHLPVAHDVRIPSAPPIRGFPAIGVTAGGGQGLAGIRAHGGAAHSDGEPQPIMASDGEFVIRPDEVARRGGGDPARGHAILDHWVTSMRKQAIHTLKKLPGPAK